MHLLSGKPSKKQLDLETDALASLSLGGFNYLIPENGIVYLSGEINEESANRVIDDLFTLYGEDPTGEKGITLIINSPGGDVYQTLAIIDVIQSLPTKVVGLALGMAGSGAFYILQACDARLMMSNSLLFWHEMISWSPSPITTSEESSRRHSEYMLLNQKLIKLLKSRSGITEDTWSNKFKGKNDLLFESKEAKQLNLVDGVIKSIKELGKYYKDNLKYEERIKLDARNDKRRSSPESLPTGGGTPKPKRNNKANEGT